MTRDFTWSVTRHACFQACRRRYFHSYHDEDPETRRLRQLSALPLWAGNVVHETIESFLRTHDTLPSPTEVEALVQAVVHERMVREWRQSEAGSPQFRLFEHEYGVPVEQEDKTIAVHTVRRSLRSFFASATLAEALAVGRGCWLGLEELVSFRVDDVTVLVRMDLAFRDRESRVVIVDWKTGRADGRFHDVQLACYALGAVEKGWVAGPEPIATEIASLALGRHVRRAVSPAGVARARAFVLKSAARMKALLADAAANGTRVEDFPRVDRPAECRRCNFRRLCFPRAPVAGPAPGRR